MSKDNYYFDEEVEDAIVEYNNTEDPIRRSRLFKNKINDAFYKLAENIINTFKYKYFDVPQEDVQSMVVSHMVEKIDKYEKDKGKAFSYFSMIAKNFCILKNKKNYKKYKRQLSLDDEDLELNLTTDGDVRDKLENEEFFDEIISHWEDKMTDMFDKERDLKIADAILELFKRRKNIETFNKKALYVMIRERAGIDRTQHITKVVKKFKDEFFEISERYYNSGEVEEQNELKDKFF